MVNAMHPNNTAKLSTELRVSRPLECRLPFEPPADHEHDRIQDRNGFGQRSQQRLQTREAAARRKSGRS